jgi:hypothetical protein
MKTPEQIAEEIVARHADLTLDDLGLAAESMIVEAIHADRAQMNEPEDTGPGSGDLCVLVSTFTVEHYRCDEYADGTRTSSIDGHVVVPPKPGALKGFNR